MRSSSPPAPPIRAESSSISKPPSRRRDKPQSSKSLGSDLHRSSSIGAHPISPPTEQEPVRRRAARVPMSAPARRKNNIGLDSLSDHFRSDGDKLPSIDILSSSRSTYTSISKAKDGASKRSSRSRISQDDSNVVRRRVRDRSVKPDLEPQAPRRTQSLVALNKSDASATSAESSQKTIGDESARSQRTSSSSQAIGKSEASDDAENEEQISPSKNKTRTTDRHRSKSAKGRRVRRSHRVDSSASFSNIDVVSSSASVTLDCDGSVISSVSNNSRRRRTKPSVSSPVSPRLTTQLETLMSEEKPRRRRRDKDSSSVASEPIPREPRRVVLRDNSSDSPEVAELERFLKVEDAKPSRRIASTRSVSSAPVPRSKRATIRPLTERPKRSVRKQTRIRMVKSDDEGEIYVMEKKASIRNLRACQTDEEDSLGEECLTVTDLLTGGRGKRSGKDARRSARHYSTGQDAVISDVENGVDNHQVDPSNAHDRMGMSMPAMSPEVMDLSALMQQQRAQKRLSGSMFASENDAGNKEDEEEDIFTFYSWSTSRQPRSKILEERKKLRDSVREGPLLASYEALMKME